MLFTPYTAALDKINIFVYNSKIIEINVHFIKKKIPQLYNFKAKYVFVIHNKISFTRNTVTINLK